MLSDSPKTISSKYGAIFFLPRLLVPEYLSPITILTLLQNRTRRISGNPFPLRMILSPPSIQINRTSQSVFSISCSIPLLNVPSFLPVFEILKWLSRSQLKVLVPSGKIATTLPFLSISSASLMPLLTVL